MTTARHWVRSLSGNETNSPVLDREASGVSNEERKHTVLRYFGIEKDSSNGLLLSGKVVANPLDVLAV